MNLGEYRKRSWPIISWDKALSPRPKIYASTYKEFEVTSELIMMAHGRHFSGLKGETLKMIT